MKSIQESSLINGVFFMIKFTKLKKKISRVIKVRASVIFVQLSPEMRWLPNAGQTWVLQIEAGKIQSWYSGVG